MSEFTEVYDDPLNPGKYISAEEQKRRDDAMINDSTAKKTKKKKKKKGQITVSSILHNADKDEPETDSDEEDQSEKLNSLLTFAKGKVAAEKRKEALEVGVFVAANEAEEQTISATQQLKIDARLKKKEDAILKERNRKKALVTQGIEAIVSTEDLLKEEFEFNNTNTNIDNIDDYFLSNNNNNSSNDVNNSAAQKQINQLKDDERITKFKEHFSKGQSYAQKQDFSKSLLHLKIAFKYLVNTTTSKYAAMCIGTAASVEFALGELRNAKKHCLQALNILQHLNIRDKKLEQIFTMTLNKTLDDLGEGTSSTTTIVIDNDKEDTKTTTGGANKKKKKGSGSKNNKKKNKKQGKQQQQATQPQSTSDLLKSLGL